MPHMVYVMLLIAVAVVKYLLRIASWLASHGILGTQCTALLSVWWYIVYCGIVLT